MDGKYLKYCIQNNFHSPFRRRLVALKGQFETDV